MVVGVVDTHAAIWHLFANPRLSQTAQQFIDQAALKSYKIAVSSISLAEMVYLDEKGRIPREAYQALLRNLNDLQGVFQEVPVTQQVVHRMHDVSRNEVPDLPDRLIAATGLHLRVPVISRDGRIRASSVQTIW